MMRKVDTPAVITNSSQIKSSTDEHSAQVASSDPAEKKIKDAFDSKRGKNINPTRYGDWEKNGRCIDF